jgi:hypothetical protein
VQLNLDVITNIALYLVEHPSGTEQIKNKVINGGFYAKSSLPSQGSIEVLARNPDGSMLFVIMVSF